MKNIILLIFLSFTGSQLFAQNQFGVIPQINASAGIGNDWKLNAKLEGRQLFYQHPFTEDRSKVEFKRADLELIASKTLSPEYALGGGYLIRSENGHLLHRIIQQFAMTQKLNSSRLVHRIRTDQTFEKSEAIQLRLRYRLSWEKPLSGLKADAGEFYLKLNNEYVGILQDKKGDLEIRGLANIGYNFSDENKIETGIDYRLEKVVSSTAVHKAFLNISFYQSF